MYALGLSTAGYNVAAFPEPASFFKALDVRMPDLVVLDWNLPGMTGGDVLKALADEIRTEAVRVVVLSNVAVREREMALAMRAGALAWFEKTRTTPLELAARLQPLLGVRKPPAYTPSTRAALSE